MFTVWHTIFVVTAVLWTAFIILVFRLDRRVEQLREDVKSLRNSLEEPR